MVFYFFGLHTDPQELSRSILSFSSPLIAVFLVCGIVVIMVFLSVGAMDFDQEMYCTCVYGSQVQRVASHFRTVILALH